MTAPRLHLARARGQRRADLGLALLCFTLGACAAAPVKPTDEWRSFFDAGQAATGAGKPAEAEVAFRQALSLAREEDPGGERTALTLSGLAVALIDQEQFDQAQTPIDEAMQIFQRQGGVHSLEYAALLTNAGQLALHLSQPAVAHARYREALNIVEDMDGSAANLLEQRSLAGLVAAARMQASTTQAAAYFDKLRQSCRKQRSTVCNEAGL